MPIETRSNSALFRRAEQLKRWADSETNKVSHEIPKDKKSKIKFSDGCVFLAACAASDTEEVERLLEKGADINTTNVDGLTALHQACIDDNLEMVQFLVEHGCDVNRADNEGWTPLHATASCGSISIANYLIEHGANVAAVNNDGNLPVDLPPSDATKMKELLTRVLEEQGIDCDAVRLEEERIMLEDANRWLNSQTYEDRVDPKTGATALHVAAAKGYVSVANILIKAGADLNAQDNDGWTPLHAAAHWGQKEVCAILADNLANMDIQNLVGQTCFDVAEPELVGVLSELKKKQTSLQKDRPDIQVILQRTSNKPPLKRRTSVTRMSCQEKSKSVMKDTKSERAQIEHLTLAEEELEDDKEKKQNDVRKLIIPKENVINQEEKKEQKEPAEPEIVKIPSWKKYLRKSSEDLEADIKLAAPELEATAKKLKTADEKVEKDVEMRHRPNDDEKKNVSWPNKNRDKAMEVCPVDSSNHSTDVKVENSSPSSVLSPSSDLSPESLSLGKSRSFIPPARDEESELQRKAHAKRVRETRRSTQGVLLEDVKTAELQYLVKTQQDAAKRQQAELEKEDVGKNEDGQDEKDSAKEINKSVEKKKGDDETGLTERTRMRYGSSVLSDESSEVSSKGDASSRYSSLSCSRSSLNDDDKDYRKLYEEVMKENERLKVELRKAEEELERTKREMQKVTQATNTKNSISETEKKERRALERKISELEEDLKLMEKLRADNERLKEENSALIRVISKLSK